MPVVRAGVGHGPMVEAPKVFAGLLWGWLPPP